MHIKDTIDNETIELCCNERVRIMESDKDYIKKLIEIAENGYATENREITVIKTLESIGSAEAMDALFHLATEGNIHTTNKDLALVASIKLRSRLIGSGKYEDSSTVKGLIDEKLYSRCAGKDYHDVANNAFPILEDRIRELLGVGRQWHGLKLIDYALNPDNGKLSIGDTKPEREGIYLLFRGAVGFLRNLPSHTMNVTMAKIEAHDLMCFVDLLLKFLEKAKKVS